MKLSLLALVAQSLFFSIGHAAGPVGEGGFGYRFVSPGIFRGGRPGKDTSMQFLVDKGIRNVVNLQGLGASFQPGEKESDIARSEELARRLGMGYFRRPFATGKDYQLKQEERERILSAVELLRDPAMQPIYVHCFFGVDRTGVTIASYRILVEGCSFEKARDEMYREGGPWTPNVTEGQLPFLQELTSFQRPGPERCPL